MKKMKCEICGGISTIKKIDDDVFECQNCGIQYSKEQLSNIMVEIDEDAKVSSEEEKNPENTFEETKAAVDSGETEASAESNSTGVADEVDGGESTPESASTSEDSVKKPVKKKKTFKNVMIALSVIIIPLVLMIGGLSLASVIKTNQDCKAVAEDLVGETFECLNDGGKDVDSYFIFTSTTECTFKKYDNSGYEQKLLEEKKCTYEVDKGRGNTFSLTVDFGNGDTMYLTRGEFSVGRWGHPRQDQYSSLKTVTEFTKKYNSNFKGSYQASGATDSDYIQAAKILLEDSLKNPSSATYHKESVYERDKYGRAIVYLDVSAQNGFGGYTREGYYIFINGINKLTDKFSYNSAAWYTKKIDDLWLFKGLNNFGENPEGGINDKVMFTEEPYLTVEDVVLSNGTVLNTYYVKNDYFVLRLYTVKGDNKVVSFKLEISPDSFKVIKEKDEEIYKKVIEELNACIGNIEYAIEGYEEVINPQTGLARGGVKFIKDGYILHSDKSNSKITYTVTLGRYLGYTEDSYWTPLLKEMMVTH